MNDESKLSRCIGIWLNSYFPEGTVHDYDTVQRLMKSKYGFNTTNPLVLSWEFIKEGGMYSLHGVDCKIVNITKSAIGQPILSDGTILKDTQDLLKIVMSNRLVYTNKYDIVNEYESVREGYLMDNYYNNLRYDDLGKFKEDAYIPRDIVIDCVHYNAQMILKYVIEELGAWVDFDSAGTQRNTAFKKACEELNVGMASYLYNVCKCNISHLIIRIPFSPDAKYNEKEKFTDMCKFLSDYSIPYTTYQEIGECAG